MRALLGLVILGFAVVEGGAQAACDLATVRASFDARVVEAEGWFSELGTVGADSEAGRDLLGRLHARLDELRADLRVLGEQAELDDAWVDESHARVEGLFFWVRRFTPLDVAEGLAEAPSELSAEELIEDAELFGDPEQPATPTPTVTDGQRVASTLPGAARPRVWSSAREALEQAIAALEADELARSLYDLTEAEVLAGGDAELLAAVAAARARLAGRKVTALHVERYLLPLLEHADPSWRSFAARELASLGSARVVTPLVNAALAAATPEAEREGLALLRSTPHRAAAEALGKLARTADAARAGRVIDVLGMEIGGRQGARGIAPFAEHDDAAIWRPAVAALAALPAARGVAELARLLGSRRTSAKTALGIVEALREHPSHAAATALLPHLARSSPLLYGASDALVAMGEHALLPLIDALTEPALRQEANAALGRISGRSQSASAETWRAWFAEWEASGRPSLPCHRRGEAPWEK